MWNLILLIIIILVIVAFLDSSETIGNWNHFFANMEYDPEEFYTLVEGILKEREVPDFSTSKREFKEGGIISHYRLYLQVSRGDYIFHICAASWGTGFFFSWWLRQKISGYTKLPVVGRFFAQASQNSTYYKLDTDAMFRSSVHSSIMEAIDQLTKAKGVRGLTELERKPDLRSFIK